MTNLKLEKDNKSGHFSFMGQCQQIKRQSVLMLLVSFDQLTRHIKDLFICCLFAIYIFPSYISDNRGPDIISYHEMA